jgi:hypothetical protein
MKNIARLLTSILLLSFFAVHSCEGYFISSIKYGFEITFPIEALQFQTAKDDQVYSIPTSYKYTWGFPSILAVYPGYHLRISSRYTLQEFVESRILTGEEHEETEGRYQVFRELPAYSYTTHIKDKEGIWRLQGLVVEGEQYIYWIEAQDYFPSDDETIIEVWGIEAEWQLLRESFSPRL